MGVAGGKAAISRWEARIVLDGEEEIWHRRFVSPADKMGLADNSERKADSPTGAGTKRGLDMLDRKIRLPGHQPDEATQEPTTREASG